MKRNKIIKVCISIMVIIGLSVCVVSCKKNNQLDNTKAEKVSEKERVFVIVNETGETINDLIVCLENGEEIPETHIINPDDVSISIKIPKEYKSYQTFIIKAETVLKNKYEKVFSVQHEIGKTTIKIQEDDLSYKDPLSGFRK